MELHQYFSLGISALGLIGGLFSYVLTLRIKHDILENNEKIEKEIQAAKDAATHAVASLRNDLIREFAATWDKSDDRRERLEKDFNDLQASMSDRILNTVNGKYVRVDLHQQTIANMQERFASMKELIEVNMGKIEQGLDRQILDLKDRIFHSNMKIG
jgi:uncharacterized membrane-anchored protein YhcB (DUF1043 family)